MITFELGSTGLARSRFVLSRLVELSDGLEVLLHPSRAPYARRWAERTRRRIERSSIAVVLALVEHDFWYVPDFLVPVPDRYEPSLDEELAAVAATPVALVRSQLELAFRLGPPMASPLDTAAPEAGDPRAPLPREVADVLDAAGVDGLIACVADQLRACWTGILADSWAAVRRVLDADVRKHAVHASRAGLDRFVDAVHPDVGCDGDRVVLQHARNAQLAAQAGVVLAPSVFLPRPAVWQGPRGLAMIGYPAHGRGQVWSVPSPLTDESRLLGTNRAALLADLGVPRSTAELAHRHGLSPATVSYHLRLMHDAGLVSRRRHGREVLYGQTDRAAAVLASPDGVAHEPDGAAS